jgi:uncharacterized protein (UPF0276 family)
LLSSVNLSDSIAPLGVGLQVNPELRWFPFEQEPVDVFEVLIDTLAAPLDSPYVMLPTALDALEPLRRRAPILAHSNCGGEFAFLPLERTAAVRRHVPIAKALASPWVADHCFYADGHGTELWSSPVQFSRAEACRLADRAKALQDLYGVPLLHENAAYYFPFPGGEMSEAEFLALLVESAGTYLHLDLHNVYTNSLNLPGYDCSDFLRTIPLDRVLAIHIAGGSRSGGVYHDWHDSPVPEPVWEMLETVLRAAKVKAVIIEYQGQAHHDDTRVLYERDDAESIRSDLHRAIRLWEEVYGADSRWSKRSAREERPGKPATAVGRSHGR